MQTEVHNAYQVIRDGGIILYPTDTIWGIGCDATNTEAIKKIFALKKRIESKSMIALVSGDRMLYQIFNQIPENAFRIWEYASKPTTLILDNPKNVSSQIVAADQSLGVRIVTDPFCYNLIERLKKPLVSTSANVSGQPSPKSFAHIDPIILNGVDYIVKLKQEQIMDTPSTIIKLSLDNKVQIIRK